MLEKLKYTIFGKLAKDNTKLHKNFQKLIEVTSKTSEIVDRKQSTRSMDFKNFKLSPTLRIIYDLKFAKSDQIKAVAEEQKRKESLSHNNQVFKRLMTSNPDICAALKRNFETSTLTKRPDLSGKGSDYTENTAAIMQRKLDKLGK